MTSRLQYWVAAACLIGAVPSALGQSPGAVRGDDFLMRINAPVTIGPTEYVATAVVISGDADVQGTVHEQIIVVGGRARISGVVEGGIAVFNGSLELTPTARVEHDVFLYRSVLDRAAGAVVNGTIDSSRGPAPGPMFAFGFWLSTSTVVIVFGLLLALLVGNGLERSAALLVQQPGAVVITSLVTWAGIPLLVALSLATVIGIPLGIATMVFLLPTLGFVGLVVSGTAIGRALLGERATEDGPPYREVAVGMIALTLVGFVPLLGGFMVFMAAIVGSGAVVFRIWSGRRQRRAPSLRPVTAH